MTLAEKQHIGWVDWAKTVGIWLMILGHGPLLTEGYAQLVYSFHMPLFFILSGMFYKPIALKESVKKDWYRLLLPYLLINFCGLLHWFILSYLPAGEYALTPVIQRVGAVLVGLGYNTDFLISLSTNHTWFLVVLFLIRTIMALGLNIYALVAGSIAGVLTLNYLGWDLLVPLDSAMLAIPFFAFGYLARRYLLKDYAKPVVCVALVVALVVTLLANHYNGRVDINTFKFGNNLLLCYLCGISGSLIIMSLCKFVGNLRGGEFAQTIASGTLPVVGFNLIAISIACKIYELLFGEGISPLEGCLIAVLVLLGFYPIIKLAKRYFPILLGMR